ncbi:MULTISPECIES: GNAT family N-acetyltransferase [unclassified Nocardia]|uniref:GNAT family N-acetyltransferase n=1 Tax=unclassified Nocardia TaxID=2637762 RepID=UPI00278BF4AA|nr:MULTISPECIES: GNAT family N-acetyltransferase [unclassified Nocardia]
MGHPFDRADIRPATAADIDPAVRTLTRAFEHYPMTRRSLAPDDYLTRLARYQLLFLTGIGLPHGRVWVTDDHSAVSVWLTPRTPLSVFADLAAEFEDISGSRADVVAMDGPVIEAHRPAEPVWGLAVVGVDPDRRGRGLGRAVIAPGLAAADAEGVRAFLETQDAANLPFYESLGFKVVGEARLPDDGPMHWAMLRPTP